MLTSNSKKSVESRQFCALLFSLMQQKMFVLRSFQAAFPPIKTPKFYFFEEEFHYESVRKQSISGD